MASSYRRSYSIINCETITWVTFWAVGSQVPCTTCTVFKTVRNTGSCSAWCNNVYIIPNIASITRTIYYSSIKTITVRCLAISSVYRMNSKPGTSLNLNNFVVNIASHYIKTISVLRGVFKSNSEIFKMKLGDFIVENYHIIVNLNKLSERSSVDL